MNELLQKLLESEVLTPETRDELQEAIETKVTEAVEAAKAEATADVRAELTEQWVNERDALIEAVDSKVGDFLDAEFAELKDDIDRFRDLEAEAAEKLVEAKAAMGDEVKADLAELVEKLDAFLEIRLTAELDELQEDIDQVKKDEFGRRIFEAFTSEFQQSFADDDSVEGTLRETEARLTESEDALEEATRRVAELERKEKLDEVLSPLSGRQKEVMEAILGNVDTANLEEGYNTFIGRVLREAEETTDQESEKEDTVLAEGESDEDTKEILENAELATGDDEELMIENEEAEVGDDKPALTESARERLNKLAGI